MRGPLEGDSETQMKSKWNKILNGIEANNSLYIHICGVGPIFAREGMWKATKWKCQPKFFIFTPCHSWMPSQLSTKGSSCLYNNRWVNWLGIHESKYPDFWRRKTILHTRIFTMCRWPKSNLFFFASMRNRNKERRTTKETGVLLLLFPQVGVPLSMISVFHSIENG